MKNRIRVARGTAKELNNLTDTDNLPAGVPIFTTDDKKLHIGNDNTTPQNTPAINSVGSEKLIEVDYSGDLAVVTDLEEGSVDNPIYFEDGIPKQCTNSLSPLNSYDSTKGTIEERLTSLGFKQGNIWDANGTNVVGYIHRQGNYALAHIVGPITPEHSTTPGFGGTLAKIAEERNYYFVTKLDIINIESSSLPVVSTSRYIVNDDSDKIRYSLYGGLMTSNVSMFDTQSGDASYSIIDELNFGLELFPIVILDVKLSSNVLTISPNLNLNTINFYNNIPLTNLEIRYTTDGSDVYTNNSTLYSGPIELSSSITTIKAAIFENYHISGLLQPSQRRVSPTFCNITEQMQHTLTADANGGNISASSGWSGTGDSSTKYIIYNQKYGILPSVSRSGYTFDGWYNGDIKISSNMTYPYDKDTQIVAKWLSN